jgi:hypothetical protein
MVLGLTDDEMWWESRSESLNLQGGAYSYIPLIAGLQANSAEWHRWRLSLSFLNLRRWDQDSHTPTT